MSAVCPCTNSTTVLLQVCRHTKRQSSFLPPPSFSFLAGSLRLCLSPEMPVTHTVNWTGVGSAIGWPEPKALGLREDRSYGALRPEAGWRQDCHLEAPPSLFPKREREG